MSDTKTDEKPARVDGPVEGLVKQPQIYKLKNIRLEGNEHGQLRENVIYAELTDENDNVVISATLEHILCAIRDRRLPTREVSVGWSEKRGAMCSTVVVHDVAV